LLLKIQALENIPNKINCFKRIMVEFCCVVLLLCIFSFGQVFSSSNVG